MFERTSDTHSNPQPFVAVLGLHSSGSSALTGVLYHLGLHLGDQLTGFYGNNPEKSCGFEAVGLRDVCEAAIRFPEAEYALDEDEIRNQLGKWIHSQWREAAERGAIAAGKYPLLCQLGPPLLDLCGNQLRVITSDRPLEKSVESLTRRTGRPREIIAAHQGWLHEGKEWTVQQMPPEHVLRIAYSDLLAEPQAVALQIAQFLNIKADDVQLDAVRKWIDPDKRNV